MVEATLSPTWDQTLVFDDVIIHGHMSMILAAPPMVLVEVFDYDSVVSVFCAYLIIIKVILCLIRLNFIM